MAPEDISNRVHKLLLAFAAMAWVCFVCYLLPLSAEWRAATLSGAVIMGQVAAGASLWTSIRVRRRTCLLGLAVSLPVAVAANTIFWYFMLK